LDSDPVPLLTSCALGLSPFFLSCYRRWPTYQWRTVFRCSALAIYQTLLPYTMIHFLYWRLKSINRQTVNYEEP
jgi:hypothetical protein